VGPIVALVLLAAFVLIGLPILVLVRLAGLADRVRVLEDELRRLKAPEALAESPTAAAPPAPLVAPSPVAPPGLPAMPPPAPVRAARSDAAQLERMEQLVGGVWLQNAGAVLLLLGVFMMIVWGYSSGRFGPGVLVAAGVGLGLAFAWRGDRAVARTPRFGHALIGTGIGIVYIALDLGYVRLHVLTPPVALTLLALVSFAAIVTGLRYRVQLIAALGVIGAFLPQFLAEWLGMGGFHFSPWMLLGYLAVVDVVVFALAARAGWSGLDLAALVIGALAWLTAFHAGTWGWGPQVGLAALYTLLALAPLPALVREQGRVRAIDLALIAVAPLALLAASARFLVWAAPESVALLLFGLAVPWMLAAWWTDARRPERDLWAPLTGAATLFFTAALERALAPDVTPLAWCAEGLLLLALGLRPRAGILRLWGHAVLVAGVAWAYANAMSAPWPGGAPFADPNVLRALGATLAALAAGALLARGRTRLLPLERHSPEGWGALGHAMLATWTCREAGNVAAASLAPGAAHRMPPPLGVSLADRREALATALRTFAWSAQAAWLLAMGASVRRISVRLSGYGLLLLTLGLFVLWPGPCSGWLDQPPLVHPTALLDLVAIAVLLAAAAWVAARREHLRAFDRRGAEVVTAIALAMLMLWNAREAGHLARAILGAVPGSVRPQERIPGSPALAPTLTSAGWLLEAIALLVVGWMRRSAFLRWCGLVLLGITVGKFLLLDLSTVDVFWRFLTAIAVGAALLGLSYAYQRRNAARAPGAST
jgi:uncharacterized membrane protein